jgi:hypothetical protein
VIKLAEHNKYKNHAESIVKCRLIHVPYFWTIASRKCYFWHAIFPQLWQDTIHNSSQQKYVSGYNFHPDMLLNTLKLRRFFFVCTETWVPVVASRVQRGQATWMASRRHQNLLLCFEDTWLSSIPMTGLLCMLWHRLFASWYPRSQHPILTSPASLDIVLTLRPLCRWRNCMPGRLFNRHNI